MSRIASSQKILLSLALAALASATLASDASAFRFGGVGAHFAAPTHFAPRGGGHFVGNIRGPISRAPIHFIPGLHPPIGRGPWHPLPPIGHGPHWPWHPLPIPVGGPMIPVGGPIVPVAVVDPIVPVPVAQPAGYVASSVAAAAAPTCGMSGSFVAITFVPTVTAADITTFLKTYNVTMADGPDGDGVYRIRLSATAIPQSQIDQLIASMRTQTAIISTVAGA